MSAPPDVKRQGRFPMTAPECPLSDLPPEQCACRRHRGGGAPGDEPVETVGRPFEAMYPGRCERCEQPIVVGESIARLADGAGYVHARGCSR